MCIVCNKVAIVASYQQYLEVSKLPHLDIIDIVWVDLADVSASTDTLGTSWEIKNQIWRCRDSLMEISRLRDVDLVSVSCEV